MVAQHLQTSHTHNGDAHWAISIGLSAVLWISIPAAAFIVAPQRRKREERKPEQEDYDYVPITLRLDKMSLNPPTVVPHIVSLKCSSVERRTSLYILYMVSIC